MFLIVLGHFSFHTNWHFQNTDIFLKSGIEWIWFGGKTGVNLFVLITAYFFSTSTQKTVRWSSLLKLWAQIFFYSVIVFLLGISVFHLQYGIKDVIRAVFPLTVGEYWFASAYFCLILFSPFLNIVVQSVSKQDYLWLLFILFALGTIESTTGNAALGIVGDNLIGLIVIYLFGGFIKRFQNDLKSIPTWCLILVGLAATLFLYISSLGLNYVHQVAGLGKGFQFAWRYYVNVSPFQIILSCNVFMLFLRIPPHYNSFINLIARGVFGVYLLSDHLFINTWFWNHVINAESMHYSVLMFPMAIVVALSILIVGIIIDLIRQALFAGFGRIFTRLFPSFSFKLLRNVPKKIINKSPISKTQG